MYVILVKNWMKSKYPKISSAKGVTFEFQLYSFISREVLFQPSKIGENFQYLQDS